MKAHPWTAATAKYAQQRENERQPVFTRRQLLSDIDQHICHAAADQFNRFLHSEEGALAVELIRAYGQPLIILSNCDALSHAKVAYALTAQGLATIHCEKADSPMVPCTAYELLFAAMLQGVCPEDFLTGVRHALDALATRAK